VTGILVAAIGLKLFLSNPVWEIRRKSREKIKGTPVQDYLSVFGMALANPFSIFIFLALFPGMDVEFTGSGYLIPLIIILGVFTGASVWWFLFSYTVSRFSKGLSLRKVVTISRITGFVIVAIGICVLLTLFISIKI